MYYLFLCDFRRKPRQIYAVNGTTEEVCKERANAFLKTYYGRRLCRGYSNIQFTDNRSHEKNLRTEPFKNSKKQSAWFEIRSETEKNEPVVLKKLRKRNKNPSK